MMIGHVTLTWPRAWALAAVGAAALLLALERRRGTPLRTGGRRPGGFYGLFELAPLLVLAPLAWGLIAPLHAGLEAPALTLGLVVAMLARNREDLLHSECALKLLWVMGAALALSWAGSDLLQIATGSAVIDEQWAVFDIGLDPRFLWTTALPLSILVGLVFLGGAPFHFWAADLVQGARPWLAPLAMAGLQSAGAAWLATRLANVDRFSPGANAVDALLGIAALAALVGGSATLLFQRRPERRVGTLASLQGGLVLALFAVDRTNAASHFGPDGIAGWAAHLALALSGAGTLARFTQVPTPLPGPGPVLFRRHAWSGAAGLYALASLAGVPGTPGARFWLGAGRAAAAAGDTWLVITLAGAWLAAFAAVARQMREAFGIVRPNLSPAQPVPGLARAALWLSGLLLAAGWVWSVI